MAARRRRLARVKSAPKKKPAEPTRKLWVPPPLKPSGGTVASEPEKKTAVPKPKVWTPPIPEPPAWERATDVNGNGFVSVAGRMLGSAVTFSRSLDGNGLIVEGVPNHKRGFDAAFQTTFTTRRVVAWRAESGTKVINDGDAEVRPFTDRLASWGAYCYDCDSQTCDACKEAIAILYGAKSYRQFLSLGFQRGIIELDDDLPF